METSYRQQSPKNLGGSAEVIVLVEMHGDRRGARAELMFVYPAKILFRHCDPAQIVFYPRYFELLNDCIEAFFDEVLGFPFQEIHRDNAVPTAAINIEFNHPSRLGDTIEIRLNVTKVGRTSLTVAYQAVGDGVTRFKATSTLVYTGNGGKPQEWPKRVREKLLECAKEDKS